MSDDSGSASGIILSFLLGGLTGAALATLYAPRTGRETRDLLGERIREGRDKGRELRDLAVERGREYVGEAERYVEHQRENVATRKERIGAAIEAGKQAYRDEKQKQES
jgi:gas vesicle protein